jgi:hypothetical protein
VDGTTLGDVFTASKQGQVLSTRVSEAESTAESPEYPVNVFTKGIQNDKRCGFHYFMISCNEETQCVQQF